MVRYQKLFLFVESGRRSELEWVAKANFLGLVRLSRIQVVPPTGIRLSGVGKMTLKRASDGMFGI